jgi:hypothetical protein
MEGSVCGARRRSKQSCPGFSTGALGITFALPFRARRRAPVVLAAQLLDLLPQLPVLGCSSRIKRISWAQSKASRSGMNHPGPILSSFSGSLKYGCGLFVTQLITFCISS